MENEELKAAVDERRVIKAVYETKVDGGNVFIIDEAFKDKLSSILVWDGKNGKAVKADVEKILVGCLYYEMKENLKYTVYFIFENGIVDSTSFMFSMCENLIYADFSNFNTTNVTDMSYMFYVCIALTELNLSSFVTKNVTNMSHMFCQCTALTKLDLSSFNTSNVTDMACMFTGCRALRKLNLSSFVFPNGCKIDDIFFGCNFENLYLPKKYDYIRKKFWCCGDIVDRYVYINGKRFDGLDPKNVRFV